MSLECVRKCRTAWCEGGKKHHRELFNLISNCEFESFSISFVDQLSISTVPPYKNQSLQEKKKSLKLCKLWKSAACCGGWVWNRHIMTSCFLTSPIPFLSNRATKGKQAWSLQHTCTTARYLQGECVYILQLLCKLALVIMTFHSWNKGKNTSHMRGIF